MATTQVPNWLATTICALDLSLSALSLALTYTTFWWTGWTWVNGKITRRDMIIAKFAVAATLWNVIGMIFSSVNLIRHPKRYTLALRLILSLILVPIKVVNFSNAIETWEKGDLDAKRLAVASHDSNLSPLPVQSSQSVRASSVVASEETAGNPTQGADTPKPTLSLDLLADIARKAALVVVGGCVIVLAITATVISLAHSPRGYHWAAIQMWTFPLGMCVFECCCGQWSGSSRRTQGRKNSSKNPKHKLVQRNEWADGTVVGAILFLAASGAGWNTRKEQITNTTEAWIQFAESLFGVGG